MLYYALVFLVIALTLATVHPSLAQDASATRASSAGQHAGHQHAPPPGAPGP